MIVIIYDVLWIESGIFGECWYDQSATPGIDEYENINATLPPHKKYV